MRKILNIKKFIKKKKYQENCKPKKEYEKNKYQENAKPKRESEEKECEKNPEPKKENRKSIHKKKKCLNKVKFFCQQIRQDPYATCTMCHRCLYKRSVRLFEHEKYNILITEIYRSVRSFDEKIYICDTCHKHLSRN